MSHYTSGDMQFTFERGCIFEAANLGADTGILLTIYPRSRPQDAVAIHFEPQDQEAVVAFSGWLENAIRANTAARCRAYRKTRFKTDRTSGSRKNTFAKVD